MTLKTEESRRVIDIPPALMRRVALVDQRGDRFIRLALARLVARLIGRARVTADARG